MALLEPSTTNKGGLATCPGLPLLSTPATMAPVIKLLIALLFSHCVALLAKASKAHITSPKTTKTRIAILARHPPANTRHHQLRFACHPPANMRTPSASPHHHHHQPMLAIHKPKLALHLPANACIIAANSQHSPSDIQRLHSIRQPTLTSSLRQRLPYSSQRLPSASLCAHSIRQSA